MECMACELTAHPDRVPGGRIATTAGWVVEHCVGPLGVGTVVVKPLRHVIHLADLQPMEASELGPLLAAVAAAVGDAAGLADDPASQVYACLWSHAERRPGHVHFVVQPVSSARMRELDAHGPALQARMFTDGEAPGVEEAASAASAVRAALLPRLGAAAMVVR
jgi:diadenosine tetraphosphate (Ap4A) HIT family hydrolase